jgi:hypothetical protein
VKRSKSPNISKHAATEMKEELDKNTGVSWDD